MSAPAGRYGSHCRCRRNRHGLAWLPCWLARERVRTGALLPLLPEEEPFSLRRSRALAGYATAAVASPPRRQRVDRGAAQGDGNALAADRGAMSHGAGDVCTRSREKARHVPLEFAPGAMKFMGSKSHSPSRSGTERERCIRRTKRYASRYESPS